METRTLVDYFRRRNGRHHTNRSPSPRRPSRLRGRLDRIVQATKILRWIEKNPFILMLAEGRSAVVACDFEIDFQSR